MCEWRTGFALVNCGGSFTFLNFTKDFRGGERRRVEPGIFGRLWEHYLSIILVVQVATCCLTEMTLSSTSTMWTWTLFDFRYNYRKWKKESVHRLSPPSRNVSFLSNVSHSPLVYAEVFVESSNTTEAWEERVFKQFRKVDRMFSSR